MRKKNLFHSHFSARSDRLKKIREKEKIEEVVFGEK
jgi:hypothetical protein